MLTMHCPQCGSEYTASASHCFRCGRSVSSSTGWNMPKPMGMAETIENFRDEMKSMPPMPPAPLSRPGTVSREPITISAQWSAMAPDGQGNPAKAFGDGDFLSGKASANLNPEQWNGNPAPASPLRPLTPDVPVFLDGAERIDLTKLPVDHWSRSHPSSDAFTNGQAGDTIPLPDAVPANAPDMENFRRIIEEQPPSLPLWTRAVAVLIAVGAGIGISTAFFHRTVSGHEQMSKDAAGHIPNVELSGFRVRRIDAHTAQIKFLAVNRGSQETSRTHIEVTLYGGHDLRYTFRLKVPSVAGGECAELSTKVDAPVSITESSDWQRLSSDYKVTD